MELLLTIKTIPKKVLLNALQSSSYIAGKWKKDKKYVGKLERVFLIKVRRPP
jgi:hypothetical protein